MSKNEELQAALEKRRIACAANQVVWGLVGTIEFLLTLRLVFHLLPHHVSVVESFIYRFTEPFVAHIAIVAPINTWGSFFDTPAAVGMIVTCILGWIASMFIDGYLASQLREASESFKNSRS